MDVVRKSGDRHARVIGKEVNGAHYFAVLTLPDQPHRVREWVSEAYRVVERNRCGDPGAANVVKVEVSSSVKISLLLYEDLRQIAFPALLESWTVYPWEGVSRYRSYKGSSNPPIFHRKELILPKRDPIRDKSLALTAELEARGLFKEPLRIGFRKDWERRLAQAGVEVRGHQVVNL